MQTLKQKYIQFLADNFSGLVIKKPLFYKWKVGLRFNLQSGDTFNSHRQILDAEGNVVPHIGDTTTKEYFEEANKRAMIIFNEAFSTTDNILLLVYDFKYKRRKISLKNYAFKQIDELRKTEISFSIINQLYEPNDKFDKWNSALINLTFNRINFKNIFKAIANTDFARQPSLDKFGFLSSKEIYFLNLDRKLIFHMYDDRGIDIIATDKETLRPLYKKLNEYILEHDRNAIEKKFA